MQRHVKEELRDVSDCGSTVAGDDASEFDPGSDDEWAPITEEYLNTLVFVRVRPCHTCTHSSNELNPLTKGPFKRCKKFPCWPWRAGSHVKPVGFICRICEWGFAYGGFITPTIPSLNEFHAAMIKSNTLTDEFLGVTKLVVIYVNRGRIKMRIRGQR
jgi:hypothetical protein